MVPDPILERLARLHPKAIDLTLSRLERLLADLGHPENKLPPVIHVAGTNGKGSTIAFLRAMYTAAQHRVHVYTSPHLVRFAERFVLAGIDISDTVLSAVLEECERLNNGRAITLFEITTAAGLTAFSRSPADLLLLEVGLGGRFDATNVIDRPALSVITAISLDHQHYLGETIEEIAFEKAGILKPGIPAVIAKQPEAALSVILEEADRIGAPTVACGRDWIVEADSDGLLFRTPNMLRRLPAPGLPGAHQFDNAGAALATVALLQSHFPVSPSAINTGLTNVRWPARLQELKRGPLLNELNNRTSLWLDGGHNADAARVIAAEVNQWKANNPELRIDLVFGTLNTRPAADFLAAFLGTVTSVRTVPIPGQVNTLSADEAAKSARHANLDAKASPDIKSAVKELAGMISGPQAILICGSLYLAGTVLKDHT
ncbi:MAG: bifunctional folylpolyglutamate synthase/dihydrofolate synthase [Rhodospirillaceae bacterium]|nr:bifunctional folylpolyglutamate synthase/dihydrofolate synthase [Rhodospirillaceae bacterium]